jgi:hypothetical protein
MRWRTVLYWAALVSLIAFVLGFVAEGFWGGAGDTNWVDQTFGFAMYLGAALAVVFGVALIAGSLSSAAWRLLRRRRSKIGSPPTQTE